MSARQNILISGTGIAGLTLAYWLKTFGFNPAMIEKRPDLHDEGYMIDFYSSGFDVAEEMGPLDALRQRHYPLSKWEFVNSQGKVQAAMDLEEFRATLRFRHFNFMRGDLESVLFESAKDTVPIRFNTSITRIDSQPDRVAVEFSDGASQTYDLVIGADGIHSHTRENL